MASLFRHEVFENEATLDMMCTAPGHPAPDEYRIGHFPKDVAGYEVFGHMGLWATIGHYVPELDVAIAGVVLDQSGFPPMLQAIGATLIETTRARSLE